MCISTQYQTSAAAPSRLAALAPTPCNFWPPSLLITRAVVEQFACNPWRAVCMHGEYREVR